jgi:hypothetical protein
VYVILHCSTAAGSCTHEQVRIIKAEAESGESNCGVIRRYLKEKKNTSKYNYFLKTCLEDIFIPADAVNMTSNTLDKMANFWRFSQNLLHLQPILTSL